MSRNKQVRVSRIADWAGWCSPCEDDARPLVLTRTGPSGPGAWLAGVGDDDRSLLLTCNVCGHWQVVPPREEDDPEVVPADEVPALEVPAPREVLAVEVPAPRQAPGVPTGRRPEPSRTVPDTTTLPAFSSDAIAAAARVLSAARAQTQRTAPRASAPRPAPLDRSRRTRSAASTARSAAARTPRQVAAAVPTSIVLPVLHAEASQRVLAGGH